jgi:hypothetical protein
MSLQHSGAKSLPAILLTWPMQHVRTQDMSCILMSDHASEASAAVEALPFDHAARWGRALGGIH